MKYFNSCALAFILVLGVLLVSGCGASEATATPVPTPSPTLETTPTPELSSEEQRIWGTWRRSMHTRGDTKVLCETCHANAMTEPGSLPELVSEDVCTQCHGEPAAMQAQANDLHSNLECTVCHDPHALTANCTNSGCHTNVASDLQILASLAVAPGHETGEQHACGSGQCHPAATKVVVEGRLKHIGTQHTFLSCAACHDALGLQVGPLENNINWDTWLPAAEGQEARPFASHVFQREVQCDRCHYQDNPWKLRFPAGN